MLTGFGLRNAISAIVDLQFKDIVRYDIMCTFSEDDEKEYTGLRTNISQTEGVNSYLFAMQKSITVKFNGKINEAYAIVPEEPSQMSDFIALRRRLHMNAVHEDKDIYSLNDEGVIINEKLARLLGGVKAGDEISFEDTDEKVIVSAITENYYQNYVYFTPVLYESVFGKYENNVFYLNMQENADTDIVSEQVLSNSQVTSINFMENAGDTFRQLIKSLNSIVYVIIGSSGALAFVVLYNLSNINISERIRELATIKVLGFYDGEVASYIYRENTVSALFGMAAGLFGGIFLNKFVVATAEVDIVMFYPDIPLSCFVFAALLTLVFTLSVNAMLYVKLKDIDMAGSMKAIE
jgi:putative ABC transport system permease protein